MTSASLRYPTGESVIDQCVEFIAGRLPAALGPPREVAVPSLAEDWWVEDRLAEGWHWPGLPDERGLRLCYRWARDRNVQTGQILLGHTTWQAADLLLHQICELLPTILIVAKEDIILAPVTAA